MMQASNNILKNIEYFGERYCEQHLGDWDKERLEKDWWEALKFFFSHSFMRGRRDELSNEYCYFTIKALEEHFEIPKGNLEESYEKLKKGKGYFDKDPILKFKNDKNIGRGNSIKHKGFNKEKNPIVHLLISKKEVEVKWDGEIYQKEISLGNDEDVMMVLDVLKFISEDGKKNIYNYLRNMIANHKVKSAYEELTNLRAIADKIAAFVIRDIGLLNPEIKIADEDYKDYKRAFPVDTWVMQIAHKLGCESEKKEEIKNYLINHCKKYHIDPLKFAAGLWFLGFHSLDILLEDCLGLVEIKKITLSNSK